MKLAQEMSEASQWRAASLYIDGFRNTTVERVTPAGCLTSPMDLTISLRERAPWCAANSRYWCYTLLALLPVFWNNLAGTSGSSQDPGKRDDNEW
jgi:hypothetical protein